MDGIWIPQNLKNSWMRSKRSDRTFDGRQLQLAAVHVTPVVPLSLIIAPSVCFFYLAQRLRIRRPEDPLVRHDGRDQGMVRHVKSRIVAFRLRQRHRLAVEHLFDLLWGTQFDRDIVPRRTVQVDRGAGAQHIERDAVMFRQDGHAAGPDLICRIPVGRHPVASHETCLDPAVLHHHGRHIVADQSHIHTASLQFIGRQPGTLEERARLVRKHFKIDPPLFCQEDRAQGRAIT